ncbi:MAG TPA: alpha/beta hydrolase [Prolixibacteraceae bacterium]|nr:alpha/beta hydrolase [Prolixibacteraceae bacterium]
MLRVKPIVKIALLLFSILFLVSCLSKKETEIKLNKGIYDGNIGNDTLIFVIDSVFPEKESLYIDSLKNANNLPAPKKNNFQIFLTRFFKNNKNDTLLYIYSGFYIHKRGMAIETKQAFSIIQKSQTASFSSLEYEGRLKHVNQQDKLNGTLKIKGKKSSIFFWKNKRNILMAIRKTALIPSTSRYNDPIFKKTAIQTDIVYGKARGYWSTTPYLDDPYVYILARGMINFWKGVKELDLDLDLYLPENDKQKLRPLLLLVHGGAFYIGNKQSETEKILGEHFASRGYVVASINYRMGFRMKQVDVERAGYMSVQDVHAALRFLSHNAKKYGIDPMHVYVAGTSAGAIASLTIAYLDNKERPKSTFGNRFKIDLGNVETSGNKYTETFKIRGVGNMWGALTDTTIISKGQNVPVISFHGDNDDIVPIDYDYPFRFMLGANRLVMSKMYGSKPVHEQLKCLKIDNKLIVFKNKGHEPQLDYFKTINHLMDTISNQLTGFFNQYTLPTIQTDFENISIEPSDSISAINYTVSYGNLSLINIIGGLQISPDSLDNRVIWYSDATDHRLEIYATNHLAATKVKNIKVELLSKKQ